MLATSCRETSSVFFNSLLGLRRFYDMNVALRIRN